MAYYLRRRNNDAAPMLVELTAAEYRAERFKASVTGWPVFQRQSPEQARSWVREGGFHETGLYVNGEGQVRYARSAA